MELGHVFSTKYCAVQIRDNVFYFTIPDMGSKELTRIAAEETANILAREVILGGVCYKHYTR